MFEECLAEAVTRAGWVVHGRVIIGNHYHLARETPKGNLGSGMQWSQTTFSVKFNRDRKVNGHVLPHVCEQTSWVRKGPKTRSQSGRDLNQVST